MYRLVPQYPRNFSKQELCKVVNYMYLLRKLNSEPNQKALPRKLFSWHMIFMWNLLPRTKEKDFVEWLKKDYGPGRYHLVEVRGGHHGFMRVIWKKDIS